MINSRDPAQQLEWLVDVLKNAEEQNEKVHILAHVPPGQNDCIDVWKNNYYKIITRLVRISMFKNNSPLVKKFFIICLIFLAGSRYGIKF